MLHNETWSSGNECKYWPSSGTGTHTSSLKFKRSETFIYFDTGRKKEKSQAACHFSKQMRNIDKKTKRAQKCSDDGPGQHNNSSVLPQEVIDESDDSVAGTGHF